MGRLIHKKQIGDKEEEKEEIGYDKENGRLRLGTAEAPKLAKITHKQSRLQQKEGRLKKKLKYDVIRKDQFRQVQKNRLLSSGKKTVYASGRKKRLLPYNEVAREEATQKDYRNVLTERDRVRFWRERRRGKLLEKGRKLIDDESLQEDESATEWKKIGRKLYRTTRGILHHNIRTLQLNHNPYKRIKDVRDKQELLQLKKNRLENRAERELHKSRISSASSAYQKRKLKKEMVSAIRTRERNWVKRTLNEFLYKKKSAKAKMKLVKKAVSILASSFSLFLFFFVLLAVVMILLLSLFAGNTQYTEMAITPNDYGTLSESTAYLKRLETDMEEYLTNRESLEDDLRGRYGEDLYEFVYELKDFGFDSLTLMAYLTVKYEAFTLELVEEELKALFEAMYTLEIEVKEELREVTVTDPENGQEERVEEWKKICYVKLHKRELEEIVEERMTAEEKERYDTYKLSSGGQQVYGPVMLEDWTNLISSDYGERIHPVTGERTFHNGIDIAVPTGTKLYSAVAGTVITAQYSESAGNYVRVQTDTGWTVTFMHMDTLEVTAGQKVKRGDFVGHSGNTGRSTGPHLHLEVRDSSGNPINPIFIIPQNCYEEETNEEI